MLAGLADWGAPGLLAGRSKGRDELMARVRAIAGWAEMLRDTLAGAAGLEQAIVATAPVAPRRHRHPRRPPRRRTIYPRPSGVRRCLTTRDKVDESVAVTEQTVQQLYTTGRSVATG